MANSPPQPKKRPPHAAPDSIYGMADPIPTPDAVEHDPDSGWALWNRVAESQDKPFQATVPATLSGRLNPGEFPPTANDKLPTMGMPATSIETVDILDEALQEVRWHNRVCLRPERWKQLYELLPGKIQEPGHWRPPPPVIGQAWFATSSIPKRLCFQEHILWAHKHGALEVVVAFYRGLPETDWLHMGDEE